MAKRKRKFLNNSFFYGIIFGIVLMSILYFQIFPVVTDTIIFVLTIGAIFGSIVGTGWSIAENLWKKGKKNLSVILYILSPILSVIAFILLIATAGGIFAN